MGFQQQNMSMYIYIYLYYIYIYICIYIYAKEKKQKNDRVQIIQTTKDGEIIRKSSRELQGFQALLGHLWPPD